jgi:hypothetical protein
LAELIDIDSALVGGSKKQDAVTVPLLLKLGIQALSNEDLEIATRGAGWNLIKQLVVSKPTAVERLRLFEPVRKDHLHVLYEQCMSTLVVRRPL